MPFVPPQSTTPRRQLVAIEITHVTTVKIRLMRPYKRPVAIHLRVVARHVGP
jgi:hypothetical protein